MYLERGGWILNRTDGPYDRAYATFDGFDTFTIASNGKTLKFADKTNVTFDAGPGSDNTTARPGARLSGKIHLLRNTGKAKLMDSAGNALDGGTKPTDL